MMVSHPRRTVPLGVVLLVFASVLFGANRAHAFCRTVTESMPAGFDPTVNGCFAGSSAAKMLYWKNACTGYSINTAASSQLSFDDATRVVADAFDAWSSATCEPSGHPSIEAMNEGPAECGLVEYNRSGPNQHVIVFRDDEWPHNDPNNTLGLTTVTFDTRTGEIYDADMEINTTIMSLVVGDPPPGGFDLNRIITHEAGHFLGLAHSPEQDAMMFTRYHGGTSGLTSDDIAGICTIYPPDGTRGATGGAVPEGPCDPTSRHGFSPKCGSLFPNTEPSIDSLDAAGGGGCSMARSHGRLAFAGPLLFAIGLLLRRRMVGSLAAFVLALGLARVASASVSIAISLEDLVRVSGAVAAVTPVEQRAVWEEGRIYTYTRVHTDTLVAGDLRDGAWIKTMGGVVGYIGQQVEGEPTLVVGSPTLLFLEHDGEPSSLIYRVTARAQGQFPLTVGTDRQARLTRARDLGLVLPSRPLDQRAGVLASDALRDRTLDEASRQIAPYWQRLHPR